MGRVYIVEKYTIGIHIYGGIYTYLPGSGNFSGILYSVNGVSSVLITDISSHNCMLWMGKLTVFYGNIQ